MELATDLLREQFGDIETIIHHTTGNERVSYQVQSFKSSHVLAYNIVKFSGARKFPKIHKAIKDGESIGEAFRKRRVPSRREERCAFMYRMPKRLKGEFLTEERDCYVKGVDLIVGKKEALYASVVEAYSPSVKFDPVVFFGDHKECKELLDDHFDKPVIREIASNTHDIEKYLTFVHNFLKRPQHVGIENPDRFQSEVMGTTSLLMSDPATRIFVAEDRRTGEIIGYLSSNSHPALHVNGYECMIKELYVDENHRRKGIGTALVEAFEDCISAVYRGRCKRISLATNWENPEQRNFYSSLGFDRRCDFVTRRLE